MTLINVCGLKTRLKNAEFSEYINKFDIILLTETKLDNLDDISVPRFHLMNKNRKHKKRASGGVAVLISDELDNYVCALDVEQVDSIWLKINDINNGHDLIMSCVYSTCKLAVR